MSEARFKAIVRTGQLAVQSTLSDDGKRQYAIPTDDEHVIQLDVPPVVGDFSKVNDPDVLLDSLAKSQLPSLVPQTGGGFFHQPGTPPQAMFVTIWEKQYAAIEKLDPRIRRLIELGERALPSVQQRLNGLAIGNLNHPASMERLLPHLRDNKVHGYAVSALASMGSKDALPLMMSELQAGNDVGGMVYQHLRLLTGEGFEAKPEPWLAWWNKNRPGPAPDKE